MTSAVFVSWALAPSMTYSPSGWLIRYAKLWWSCICNALFCLPSLRNSWYCPTGSSLTDSRKVKRWCSWSKSAYCLSCWQVTAQNQRPTLSRRSRASSSLILRISWISSSKCSSNCSCVFCILRLISSSSSFCNLSKASSISSGVRHDS